MNYEHYTRALSFFLVAESSNLTHYICILEVITPVKIGTVIYNTKGKYFIARSVFRSILIVF